MKIVNKMNLTLGLMILLSAAVGAAAGLSTMWMRRSVDVVKEKTFQSAMIEDLSTKVYQWVISMEFILQGEEKFQDFHHLSTVLLEESLLSLETKNLSKEELPLLEEVSSRFQALQELLKAFVGGEKRERLTEEIEGLIRELIRKTETLKSSHNLLMGRVIARADMARDIGKYVSIAVPAVSAILAIVLGLTVRRSVVSSIRHLLSATRIIASGDLSQSVGLRSKDEFGELATAFDTMREELRQDKQKLEELSVTDALTGLYNRRYLQAKLVEEVVRTNRFHRPLSMIFVDVDRFKSYNDSYGHQEGDKVLKGLAEVLLRDTRKKIDIAYRYGGEEFVVVLPETNGEQAVVVAERILKNFRGLDFTPKGIVEPIRLTFSAGVTSLKAGEEGASLLERADQAMYQAKSMGRNRVVKA
ncbi:MAG TPA: diguanylate cyclase [Candidatus Tripitaka sp. YC43]